MKTLLRPAISLFVLLSLITGIAYPLLVTGITKVAFPDQAGGSLIAREGKMVGSALIGQNFSDVKYFWGRLSATGPFPYNGAVSSGSNLGPLNPALIDAAKDRINALKASDANNKPPIPIDLVTTSGSGLDPNISPDAAEYQVERIAKARGVAASTVRAVVASNTEGRQWGVFGAPRVNVLLLNLALDRTTTN